MAHAATKEVTEQQEAGPIARLKMAISSASVQQQFKNALQDGAPLFVASLIDIYGSDRYLQACQPKDVIMEALKAATLKLPINKNLGFAYIVPYKEKGTPKPQFQCGYRGYIQLAQRTGQYRYINADVVHEGELRHFDKLTGELDINGEATGSTIIGYFAYIETINGFRKALFWSKERVEAHAQRYSKSWGQERSAWTTNFDEMALKTMIRNLLSKYGIMSVEMVQAFTSDADERSLSAQADDEIASYANKGDVIDLPPRSKDETLPQTGPSYSVVCPPTGFQEGGEVTRVFCEEQCEQFNGCPVWVEPSKNTGPDF